MRIYIYNTINTTGHVSLSVYLGIDMKLSFDTVVGVLAPHLCLACGREGATLCTDCLETAGEQIPPRCAGCRKLSPNWKTCRTCKAWLYADSVYVATTYEGIYEQLVRSLKFETQRQSATPMAQLMAEIVPASLQNYIVCAVPSAPKRIRERGFDHARLLMRNFSCLTHSPFDTVLYRKTNVRQVGSTRSRRLEQMQAEFFVRHPDKVAGESFLLIDDVMTTGASVSAAAHTLKQAGAKHVSVVVFAQKV